jgi:hypothetical protein
MSADSAGHPGSCGRRLRMAMGLALLGLGVETLLTPPDWITATVPQSPGMWMDAATCFAVLRGVPEKEGRSLPPYVVLVSWLYSPLWRVLAPGFSSGM